MNKIPNLLPFLLVMAITACHPSDQKQKTDQMKTFQKGSFGYDLNFLAAYDSVITLSSNEGNGRLLVSAKYQAKVFTSTTDGLEGQSLGWVNYEAFDKPLDPHMNAYGGEDRFWLGPEGGKFSLYFKKGDSMVFENWHTPKAIDSEPWMLISADSKKASFSKTTEVSNYTGTKLAMKLYRDVQVLEKSDIENTLAITLSDEIKSVAFKTTNTIENNGSNAWDEKNGAPCTWNLDMFAPSAKTVIVIPYLTNATVKIATTDYFEEIDKNRIKYENGVLLYKADGKSRGKLGIPPLRAKNIAGSYAADKNVLTIVNFDVSNKSRYLNQEWRTDKDPFSGDAVNAYNDGPLDDGTQMGPFYEIESVSPPAFLKPGGKMSHQHSVFHFTGEKKALNQIAEKLLGISLDEIEQAF